MPFCHVLPGVYWGSRRPNRNRIEFMTDVFQLYLASASPRRRELLQQIGVRFELISAPIDETPLPNEPPADYVRRLALAKAQAGLQVIGGSAQQPVLGADTTVVIDGEMLGKPESREHGLAMLARLSGREHQVGEHFERIVVEPERLSPRSPGFLHCFCSGSSETELVGDLRHGFRVSHHPLARHLLSPSGPSELVEVVGLELDE